MLIRISILNMHNKSTYYILLNNNFLFFGLREVCWQFVLEVNSIVAKLQSSKEAKLPEK